MGNKRKSTGAEVSATTKEDSKQAQGLFASTQAKLDPGLASLFSASSGPVKAPAPRRRISKGVESAAADGEKDGSAAPVPDDERSSQSEDDQEDAENDEELSELESNASSASEAAPLPPPEKKRKRKPADDDLEANYLTKLAKEEEDEQKQLRQERKQKRAKLEQDEPASSSDVDADDAGPTTNGAEASPPPKHETVDDTSKTQTELDKAARTVFLANVSITAITDQAAKKDLQTHLSSHFSTLPKLEIPHKIESFRFRSTAFASPLPKKASFTRGELKEATSHSTNAYCVYSTKPAARQAALRLNGTVVLGRHLRVDEVAHPMKIDHRRCVFVGNLGFVDDETEMKAALAQSEHPEDKKKAQSKALKGDVEEGLWVQFAKAGAVESVRVVRDPQTRIGKGFAYVQFKEENAVERALLFNDKKFPPMLPRKLRVTRCKKPSQTALAVEKNKKRAREAEMSEKLNKKRKARIEESTGVKDEEAALQGRLKKMLGKAGVAELKTAAKAQRNKPKAPVNSVLKPDGMVFEGHRATADQGNRGLKLGGGKKQKGRGQVKKRSDRDKKRAAAYKNKQKAK